MSDPQESKNLITLKEAAELTGYTRDYIGYLIRRKKIWGKRVSSSFGDFWVTTKEELERYEKLKVHSSVKKQKNGDIYALGEERMPKSKRRNFNKRESIPREVAKRFTRRSFNFIQTFILSVLLLVGLFAFSVVALTPKQHTLEIFPTAVEGDWKEGELAFQRDLNSTAFLALFTTQNSSFLGDKTHDVTIQPENGEEPEFILIFPDEPASSADEEPATASSTAPLEDTERGPSTGSDPVDDVPVEGSLLETASSMPFGEDSTESQEPTQENVEGGAVVVPTEEPPSDPEVEPGPQGEIPLEDTVTDEGSQASLQKSFSRFFTPAFAQDAESVLPILDSQEAASSAIPLDDSGQDASETFKEQVPLQEEPTETASSTEPDLPADEAGQVPLEIPEEDPPIQEPEDASLTLFTSKKSVTYSGFTIPEDSEVLERTAIGISLAYEGDATYSDEILIDWSLDGLEWSNILTLSQNAEYSNALNGDYLYIYLPATVTWEDIQNLKLRLTSLSNNSEETRPLIYLDAVWIDATVSGQQPLPKVRFESSRDLIAGKDHFSSNEEIVLIIEDPQYRKAELRQLIQDKRATLLEGKIEQLEENSFLAEVTKPVANAVSNIAQGLFQKAQDLILPGPQDLPPEPTPLEESSGLQPIPAEDIPLETAPDEPSDQETASSTIPTEDVPESVLEPPQPSTGSDPVDGEDDISATEPGSEPEPSQESIPEEPTPEPTPEEPEDEPLIEEVPPEPQQEPIPEEQPTETVPVEEVSPEPVPDLEPPAETVVGPGPTSFWKSLLGIATAEAKKDPLRLTLFNPAGQKVDVTPIITVTTQFGRDVYEVRIPKPERGFFPGAYTLSAELDTPDAILVSDLDFTWGVLTINVNKSMYLPGEVAYIQMGVVDDRGHTVCDATLDLQVIHRASNTAAVLSTNDQTIQYSGECKGDTFSATPDYFGYVQLPQDTGVYEMNLTATTNNGIHTVVDTFEVRDAIPFDVERFGPSRIFPPATYEMKFKIIPTDDFAGRVVESVPSEFGILNKYNPEEKGDTKELVWNVDWKAGGTYELEYQFQTPSKSPYLYLLGPLKFERKATPPPLPLQVAETLPDFTNDNLAGIGGALGLDLIPALPQLSTGSDPVDGGNTGGVGSVDTNIGGVVGSAGVRTVPALRVVFEEIRKWQIAADATGEVNPDGDSDANIGTQFANCTNSCADHYTEVDEAGASYDNTDYTYTATSQGTYVEEEFTMTEVAGASTEVTQVDVIYQVFANEGCAGGTCDDIHTRIFIDGSYTATSTWPVPASDTATTVSFTGTWTGDDDLRVELMREVQPAEGGCGLGSDIGGGQCRLIVTTTGAGSLTIPGDWTDTNLIEVIGGGGGGGGDQGDASAGGGGGAYASSSPSGLTGSIDYSVGTGGGINTNGSDTWFNHATTCASASVCAGGGTGATDEGTGGAAAGGTVIVGTGFAGGAGGLSGNGVDDGGGGGGGAGGPNGVGGTGGSSGDAASAGVDGGSGGGGGDGGGNGTDAPSDTGGAGGNGPGGTGGGAAGNPGNPGTAGTGGGGGGGSDSNNQENGGGGGTGDGTSSGTGWGAGIGSGGGGAGGADAGEGGDGGLYGAGGGGHGEDGKNGANNANGAQGILVVTYTRAAGANDDDVRIGHVYANVTYTVVTSDVTPTVATSTDSPDPVAQGNAIEFTVGWEDANAGEAWTEATSAAQWAARENHTSVVFATSTTEYMWMIGGDTGTATNDVWLSTDGVDWTQTTANAQFTAREEHASVVFTPSPVLASSTAMWVIGGNTGAGCTTACVNDVWYSTDGIDWTQTTANAQWIGRQRHTSVVFDSKMWVIGGVENITARNDVWYSTDGIDWTQATVTAQWEGRQNHSSVVLDSKIWAIGGNPQSACPDITHCNDVWYSTDGKDWTAATINAQWAKRTAHTSVVYNSKIWIIGGTIGTLVNDVWYSTDGVDWTEAVTNAEWAARDAHSSVIFDSRIWVMGGATTGERFQDVWHTSGEAAKIHICKTNVIDASVTEGQCASGETWVSTATATSTHLLTESYTTAATDIGYQTYWAFACSDAGTDPDSCSINATSGAQWVPAGLRTDGTGTVDLAQWEARDEFSSLIFTPTGATTSRMWVIGGDPNNAVSGCPDTTHCNDVWYSTDGIDWTRSTVNSQWEARKNHSSLVYDSKMWIMGGDPLNAASVCPDTVNCNDVWYSTDGIDWTKATTDAQWEARNSHSSVVYDSKMWVIGGNPLAASGCPSTGGCNDAWYSTDGIDWTRATVNAQWTARNFLPSIVYDNRIWIIGGNPAATVAGCSVAFGGCNDVWYSVDGFDWTRATVNAQWEFRERHTSVAYDNKLWIIGGLHCCANFRDVWYSTDGIDWTRSTAIAAFDNRNDHTSLVFDNQMWVVGGSHIGSLPGCISNVACNDVWRTDAATGLFYVNVAPTITSVSDTPDPLIPASTTTFTVDWNDRNTFYRPEKGDGISEFQPAQESSAYVGDNWTRKTIAAQWEVRQDHTSVVFTPPLYVASSSAMWVMGGATSTLRFNDIWHSTDGVDWTQTTANAQFAGRSGHTSVVFTPSLAVASSTAMWMIGGLDPTSVNDIWHSTDGVDWIQATVNAQWGRRSSHASVVFDNKMWVIGGFDDAAADRVNDVWYSTDGTDWTRATASAQWGKRNSNGSLVFDNKMWVIGGFEDTSNSCDPGAGQRCNDVWYSADGIDWTRATANAQFEARQNFSSVIFDSKMWIIGGFDGTNRINDVWYSTDGKDWTQATADAQWTGRSNHTSVVFDSRMWAIGGGDGTVQFNDVWYSDIETVKVKTYVCRTNEITDAENGGACQGGQDIASTTAFATTNPVDLTYTVTATELDTGTNTYWAFACDDKRVSNSCTASTVAGVDWTPARPKTEGSGSAQWEARIDYTSLVFTPPSYVASSSVMWVIGGNPLFAAGGCPDVGNCNDIWHSTDGIDWTQATASAQWDARNNHSSVVYDSKMWVIGGNPPGAVAGCPDALHCNDVWYSTDGIDWTRAVLDAQWEARLDHTSLVYDSKMWVIGGNPDAGTDCPNAEYCNDVWYSTDGIDWTRATVNAQWEARFNGSSLVFDSKMWVIGGDPQAAVSGCPTTVDCNDVWYSTDGKDWTRATANSQWEARRVHSSVVFDAKMWVMGGLPNLVDGCPDTSHCNDVWYSTDGKDWTRATVNAGWEARFSHSSLVYDNSMWIMAGDPLAQVPGCTSNVYCNDVWRTDRGTGLFYVNRQPTITSIADAPDPSEIGNTVTFTVDWNDPNTYQRPEKGDGISEFQPAQESSAYVGDNWTRKTIAAPWAARTNPTSLFFTPALSVASSTAMWVMGGQDVEASSSDVWLSTDGFDWTQATASSQWTARSLAASLVFTPPGATSRMWVIAGTAGGSVNDVWYSTDGTDWTSATANAQFSVRNNHTSLVFTPPLYVASSTVMWVMGGNEGTVNVCDASGQDNCNDVWYSTDGTDWTQATANAQWAGRQSHTSSVFDSKIWVIGGTGSTNDVWYSTDGIDWTSATAAAQFAGRFGQTPSVFDSKMWIIGGFDGTNRINDVWYSTDGKDWTVSTFSAGWSGRDGLTSLVFNGQMWVIGGARVGGVQHNDVWYADIYEENTKAHICKTGTIENVASGGNCESGQEWASASSSAFSLTNPHELTYVTVAGDVGANTYYAFVCDDTTLSNACSTATSSTFTVNAAGAGVTASGTVYTNEAKSANIGGAKTVQLFVNAVDSGTAETNADGQFAITSVTVAADDTVVAYINDETENGSVVTIAVNSSTDITGFDIITDRFIVESRTAASMTNTDLDDIDGVDAGNEDGVAISGGAATVADTLELLIPSGEAYAPGGNVTAQKMDVKGTYTGASETLTLTGSGTGNCAASQATTRPLCIDGGTFTSSSNTTSITATSTTEIEAGGTYNVLTLDPAGATTPTYTLGTTTGQTLDVNGNFTIGDGADGPLVTATSANGTIFDIEGNVTINASSTLVASTSPTFAVAGSWFNDGTFTHSSSVVTFDATATGREIGSRTTVATTTFGGLTFDGIGGEWTTATSTIRAVADFNLTHGSLVQGANVNILLEGDTVTASGTEATFTKASGSGMFTLDGVSDNQTFEDATTTPRNWGAVYIGQSPGTTNLNSDFAADTLTVNSGDTFNTRGYEVDIASSVKVFGTLDATDNATGNHEGDGSIITIGENWAVYSGAIFTADEDIDGTNTTVTFDHYENGFLDAGGTTENFNFHDLNISKTSAATVTASGSDINIDGNFALTTANSTFDVSTTCSAAACDLTVEGNWTNTAGGTFTEQTGSVTFDSATTTVRTIDSGADNFYNVSFTDAVGGADGATYLLESALDVDKNLTISASSTVDANSSENNLVSIAENFTQNSTFLAQSGTVFFDTTASSVITGTGSPAISFFNLTATTAGKGLVFASDQTFRINGLFTIDGDDGNEVVITSDDSVSAGVNWTQATSAAQWGARWTHTSLVFTPPQHVASSSAMWVIGGFDSPNEVNDVWYSTDGIDWTRATAAAQWGKRDQHTSLVFDSKMWVIGGSDTQASDRVNDVWYSTDGIDWTRATANALWAKRSSHTSSVFDSKMWIIGGWDTADYVNDVWYSFDGIDWTQTTVNAQWVKRGFSTSPVFTPPQYVASSTAMWVVGGYDGAAADYVNDVWYSTDGIDWTQASANVQWAARSDHTSLIYDNPSGSGQAMWVIGGDDFVGVGGEYNDVWYSIDGADWTRATAAAQWGRRNEHTSVVFDSKMWVMGGFDNAPADYVNDVWSTPGNQWLVNHQGTEDITFANIYNSGCTFDSTDIDVNNSIDGGNNGPCWLFPSLTFTIDTTSVSMALDASNDFTNTAQSILNVTAQAQLGYQVTAYKTQALTKGTDTIADFQGTHTTPDNWENTCNTDPTNMCGFGYTTDDISLPAPNPDRFVIAAGACTTAPCYAAFSDTAPGDVVGDLTTSVENDLSIITYRASVLDIQAAGEYTTTIIYIATPEF